MKKPLTLGLAALCFAAPALAQPPQHPPTHQEEVDVLIRPPGPPPVPRPPPMPRPPPVPGAYHGIPPHLVQKLGLPQDMVQKVQDMTFDANEKLINLEADLKRAQLALERLLRAPSPAEADVLRQVEEVGRAETAVRKNRIQLMVAIKRLLGPDNWAKLEAEMGELPERIRLHRP